MRTTKKTISKKTVTVSKTATKKTTSKKTAVKKPVSMKRNSSAANVKFCKCGCGAIVRRQFLQGHDMKLKSFLMQGKTVVAHEARV